MEKERERIEGGGGEAKARSLLSGRAFRPVRKKEREREREGEES